MRRIGMWIVAVVVLAVALGCGEEAAPQSASGVRKATVKVQTGSDGLTVEQRAIGARSSLENAPGAVKHLYVISAYSGQCILYSTVRGKVTSSSKRLTPYSVSSVDARMGATLSGFPIAIGGRDCRTPEVLQDDGTYGSSIPYLFWWDAQGRYHQHYVSGGQILHISDQPIAMKSIIINVQSAQ